MQQARVSDIPLLELDLLKTLVAIVDSGNFSSAAEILHRTPSAISMQVKRLEELVGRPMFKRDSRSVTTTPEGEMLLVHGRRVLALNQEVVKQFLAPDIAGIVRLGAPDDLAESSLPALLRRFSETHCCVTVDVVVDNSANLANRVSAGDLDLTLVTVNPENPLAKGVEVLFRERLVWAGVSHGVAYEQDPLPVSVWEEGCSWRSAGLSSLDRIGREYRIAFMSAHLSGQRAAIQADLAIAPIPASSCTNGIVELGEPQGLPALQDYALGLMISDNPGVPAMAAADHMRQYFSQSTR